MSKISNILSRIEHKLYIRFVCQYLYTNSLGQKVYMAPDPCFYKLITTGEEDYLVDYHDLEKGECFYSEFHDFDGNIL